MKKIDRLIRLKLAREIKGAKLEPTPACCCDVDLNGYVSGSISAAKREVVARHLSECLLCLDKVVACHEAGRLLSNGKIKTPPARVVWKAKNIDRMGDDPIADRPFFSFDRNRVLPRAKKTVITEKTVVNWLPKRLRKNRWLIASMTAFVLSFAFPPVFLQFLLAAGIFGGKWIFDSENARTLIMIYNAWKKGGDKEVGDLMEILKDRIPNK